ncbi:hypothetical protein QFC22_002382 [Naganishia vaughanmartiniae]|uniref:Uncharacterized protein n=1 Tax=Naganishia vaughanmartiniae TaxID=1424756 RepID=A0ACC2XDT6_9TREE|nr:hypothetical protein QFC22_002382 [Naganishia vaughanmartiniae]
MSQGPEVPPDYTPARPEVLVSPLPDRLSYLNNDAVEGELYVKGVSENGQGDRNLSMISIRLRLTDKLPSHSPLLLYNTPWHTIYAPSKPGFSEKSHFSPSDGYRFNLPLEGSNLPGCLHLTDRGDGEVQWELEVNIRQGSESRFEDIRSSHEIHLTPYDNGDDNDGLSKQAQGGSEKSRLGNLHDVTEEFVESEAGMRVRMVLPRTSTRNDESLPFGVEIWKLDDTPEASNKLKSLRRVKVEWWRRVRTPVFRSTTLNQTAGPSSRLVDAEQQEYLSILHRSGKSCRYSAEKPVRLLFELPPLTNITQMPGHDTCGEITQDTPYHNISFFVKVIVGFQGQDQNELEMSRIVEVRRAKWQETATQEFRQSTDIINDVEPLALVPSDLDDEDYPMTDEVRQQAYRLKGVDIVGGTGTFRLDAAGSSGSAAGPGDPELPSFEAAARDGRPPTFMQAIAAEPGNSGATGAQSDERDGELPSFNESQSLLTRQNNQTSGPGAPPPVMGSDASRTGLSSRRTPPPTQLTGELATWKEFDGYETFSQPPPAAMESLGASGVMDIDTPDMNELDPAALQDRIQLMESLGLGEGSRVIDTQEDMPPGFDEPSLPALPNAIMPHHQRNRTHSSAHRRGSTDAHAESPPAFPEDTTAPSAVAGGAEPEERNAPASQQHLHPPPSFAASEAAEAQGMNATGPLPILAHPPAPAVPSRRGSHAQPAVERVGDGVQTPDLPPSYSNDDTVRHTGQRADQIVPPLDAPPSYT